MFEGLEYGIDNSIHLLSKPEKIKPAGIVNDGVIYPDILIMKVLSLTLLKLSVALTTKV